MSSKQLFYLLLATFFGVNIITAATTDLSHDEAYYWMYSEFLDWGYFDHPPMVALFNFLGYQLINNEIGLRLFSIIATCCGLLFTYRLTNQNNPLLFWGLVLGMFAFNILGFTSVPDNGLFFFAAFFFWAYRRFLKEESLINIVYLIIAITGMLYSKYHTVFVIAFTLLSNIKLLKNKYLYLIAAIVSILYLPHILWQFNHEFPSLKYHISDRTSGFNFEYLLDYLTGTLLYFGPLLLVVLFYPIIKTKSSNKLDSALRFNFYGFLIFFMLMSIKGRVEMNWNVTATIPFLVLSVQSWSDLEKNWKKVIKYSVITSVVLLATLRGVIIIDAIPVKQEKISEMKGWQSFINIIDSTYNHPEYVATTYQMASKFSFYTGKYAYCKNFAGRHNQYNIWGINDTLQGKNVVFLGELFRSGKQFTTPQNRTLYISQLPEFYTYELTDITSDTTTLECSLDDTLYTQVQIHTPFKRDLCDDIYPTAIIHHFYDTEWQSIPRSIAAYPDFGKNMITRTNGEYELQLNNKPSIKGEYYVTLSIITDGIAQYIPSDTLKVIIKD